MISPCSACAAPPVASSGPSAHSHDTLRLPHRMDRAPRPRVRHKAGRRVSLNQCAVWVASGRVRGHPWARMWKSTEKMTTAAGMMCPIQPDQIRRVLLQNYKRNTRGVAAGGYQRKRVRHLASCPGAPVAQRECRHPVLQHPLVVRYLLDWNGRWRCRVSTSSPSQRRKALCSQSPVSTRRTGPLCRFRYRRARHRVRNLRVGSSGSTSLLRALLVSQVARVHRLFCLVQIGQPVRRH